MRTICLIIHSLGIGGMERVMAQLANNFAERKHVKVHLVLIGKKREIDYDISNAVIVHKPDFKFNSARRTIDTIRTVFFLRSRVKQINPDTILSFGEMWNNLVLIALYGVDYPIFIADRSQPNKDLGKIHNILRQRLYPNATGYIAQTSAAEKVCLENSWNKNVEVIGNPIRCIQKNGGMVKENIVLSVGRLIKTKHFDQLINMFVEINVPNWKLVIVGGDAKKQYLSKDLKSLIRELGVDQKVILEGQQKNVDSYYQRSKVFAFTSSSEGFPNVIGEAISAGLPVVSYDCVAGPSDMIIDGENGYLIPLFDKELFKEKLRSLMVDDSLRRQMSTMCNTSILEFTEGSLIGKYYNFINGHIPKKNN